MWRSPYQAPPQPQSLTLDTLSKRTVFDNLLPENLSPVAFAQFYPPWIQPPDVQNRALDALSIRQAVPTLLQGFPLGNVPPPPWVQPPPLQSPGATLSKLAVATPLSPPFTATVLGRVEQFYPAWVQPPVVQDPKALGAIGLGHSQPLLQTIYGNVPPPTWIQPPSVQTTALDALSKLATVTVVSPPFTFQAYGNVPPPPWVQPPRPQPILEWGNSTPVVTVVPGPIPGAGWGNKRNRSLYDELEAEGFFAPQPFDWKKEEELLTLLLLGIDPNEQ